MILWFFYLLFFVIYHFSSSNIDQNLLLQKVKFSDEFQPESILLMNDKDNCYTKLNDAVFNHYYCICYLQLFNT